MRFILLFLFISFVIANGDVDKCGIPKVRASTGKVTNGKNAKDFNFPWMVSFQKKPKRLNEYQHFCGGVIISPKYVLSAAHCFHKFRDNNFIAVTDSIDLTSTNKVQWEVEKFIKHPDYDANTNNNDIALVKLKTELTPYTWSRKPICLPVQGDQVANEVIIIGWGRKTEDGENSNILQFVQTDIVSSRLCKTRFKQNITKNMICAGDDEKDACQGDSGGPLTQDSDGVNYVLGVVSFGTGCGRKGIPGVFTKVPNFVDWINQNIDS